MAINVACADLCSSHRRWLIGFVFAWVAFAEAATLLAISSGVPGARRDYSIISQRQEDPATRYSGAQLVLLEKLNRRDIAHLARARMLVVPKEWSEDELHYSPLPMMWAWATQFPKVVIVDQAAQVFGGYEYGQLVRWGPVSSGRRRHPTPAGLFHLNWRSSGRSSTENPNWYMPLYFNFHNRRGLAFHEFHLPGRPASHACIRLLERDARWLYEWGQGWTLDEMEQNVIRPGTPVVILGHYDFDAPPPWLSLTWLARGVTLPNDVNVVR